MANSGEPNTNASQFYVTYKAASFLDYENVCFGHLIKGKTVMEDLKKYGSDTGKVWGAKIVIGDCGTSDTL